MCTLWKLTGQVSNLIHILCVCASTGEALYLGGKPDEINDAFLA